MVRIPLPLHHRRQFIDASTERDDRLDLLDYLARHANIRGSIMQTRHKSALHGSHNETDQALEVEADHTKWWNMVDDHLSDDERMQSISKAHQITLIVLRFESVLALHRSVLATTKKDAAYNAALQRCISASRSIINTLHKALKGFGAFDGSPGQNGYERTPLLWPSFTWAVWMSVFIVFSATTEGQVPRDVTLRLVDRSIQILKHLALRGTSWPDACIVAIQNLTAHLREPSTTRSTTALPGGVSGPRASVDPSASISRDANTSRNGRMVQDQADARAVGNQQSTGQMTPHGTMGSTLLAGNPQNFTNQSYFPTHSTGIINNTEALNIPNDFRDGYNLTNAHFAGSGTFLGIAQQSSDNPLPNDDIMHLFNGDDMAYWLGGDFGSNGNLSFH